MKTYTKFEFNFCYRAFNIYFVRVKFSLHKHRSMYILLDKSTLDFSHCALLQLKLQNYRHVAGDTVTIFIFYHISY